MWQRPATPVSLLFIASFGEMTSVHRELLAKDDDDFYLSGVHFRNDVVRAPINSPSCLPTLPPTTEPNEVPTNVPSSLLWTSNTRRILTANQTSVPTSIPSLTPSQSPMAWPSASPTTLPTAVPTLNSYSSSASSHSGGKHSSHDHATWMITTGIFFFLSLVFLGFIAAKRHVRQMREARLLSPESLSDEDRDTYAWSYSTSSVRRTNRDVQHEAVMSNINPVGSPDSSNSRLLFDV